MSIQVDEWTTFVVDWGRRAWRLDHVAEALAPLRAVDAGAADARRRVERIVAEARARLAEASTPPNTRLLHNVLLAAYMAGRWEASEAVFRLQDDPDEPRLVLDFRMVPDDAIRFFLARRVVSAEEFRALEEALRPYVFAVSRLADLRLVERIRHVLLRALEEGAPFTAFYRTVRDILLEAGAPELARAYLEVVFRAQVGTALNAGRWDAYMRDPFAEIIVYKTMADGRVRPAHRAMHNFSAPKDDPVWQVWWPPNGFNCRCKVVAMTRTAWEIRKARREAVAADARASERWRLTYKTRWPRRRGRRVMPDPGWQQAPAPFVLWPPRGG